MELRTVLCVLACLAAAPGAGAQSDTRAFQKLLLRDLETGVAQWQRAFADIAAKADPKVPGYGYGMYAETVLHSKTGNPALIEAARREMLWHAGQGRPVHGFHFSAFSEAYIYLRDRGVFSASERAPNRSPDPQDGAKASTISPIGARTTARSFRARRTTMPPRRFPPTPRRRNGGNGAMR